MTDRTCTSLCSRCFKKINAKIVEVDNEVFLFKKCDVHGSEMVQIEKDITFFNKIYNYDKNKDYMYKVNFGTVISLNDICNLNCPSCYQVNSNDPKSNITIENALSLVKNVKKTKLLILSGGEPTLHPNLFDLIDIFKNNFDLFSSLYTNLTVLDDEKYVESLKKTKLLNICGSLHLPDYHNETVYNKKLNALKNIKNQEIPIHHLAFNLTGLDKLNALLSSCISELSTYTNTFRIRIPTSIGQNSAGTFFLSDMCNEFEKYCTDNKLKFSMLTTRNTLYCVFYAVDNKYLFMLYKWPTLSDVIIDLIDGRPAYSLIVPEMGEINFITSIIFQELLKKNLISLETIAANNYNFN